MSYEEMLDILSTQDFRNWGLYLMADLHKIVFYLGFGLDRLRCNQSNLVYGV